MVQGNEAVRNTVRSPSGRWIIILGASLSVSSLCEFCNIVKSTQSLPKCIFSRFFWDQIPNSISYINVTFSSQFSRCSSCSPGGIIHVGICVNSSVALLCLRCARIYLFIISPIMFIKIWIMHLGKWMCLFFFPQANPIYG